MKVKWIRPHVKNCYAALHWAINPWAYFVQNEVLYRDSRGGNRGAGHRWLQARCNIHECDGLVIVCESDLLKLVQKQLTAIEATDEITPRG